MSDSPFSARNRGAHRHIDSDFPSSARNGLLHILIDLVEKEYVENWACVARELRRIDRQSPVSYSSSSAGSLRQAQMDSETIINEMKWDKAYDFCERLHNTLARATGHYWNDEFHEKISKDEVRTFISEEIQRLFEEESLAFEFSQGLVRRRGRRHTVDVTTRAQVVLGDTRLVNSRRHYDKAIAFFRNPINPDFENSVKEAVCAVEAAGKALFPMAKATTLGDLAKWFSSTKDVSVPKALAQTITGIYAYRSGGDGVGHGGSVGGAATAEVTEYVLAVCASQIIYFVDVACQLDSDVAF
ncbi:hypothetical protein F471_01707 [Pseudomonas sp. URMO17WK12:I1]|uniref:AbiJ-NTD4 domain-containing protein n=1 Tax=unclassified Pseudomonas TaxID=196821 RepID=UPI000DB3545B|nr:MULTISPECIES: hypothetical protein [unclassified Pseudomonas]PZW68402.1 hypothetical protein F471_01707 [Pseudomonas sp. URMO17WK12:I1]